ncbi:MAG: efflux RND transporter periplasmic adaptor subunit [Bacteroidetes bacterium]|nr:efflux RND transporter periplasmic adaptor subunit [Bacteroidota bacterium]MBU1115545.1 efflux RND transporter periplasmic adaptor subunit [Bacteroidota bacterium]MBU1797701.1 efflux RND transporter periplasmic adaptor subunit [Bacteroidota bacterium]
MEKKNKLIYLIIGIVIGAVVAFEILTLLKSSGDTEMHSAEAAGHAEENNEGDEHQEESVKLTDSEINELGIQLEKVSSKKLQMHTDLTGEIVTDPDKLAHIVPRFAGVVKTVSVKIGDKVKKDEVIAVIESNESLVNYEVKSSIDGVVLELHMTPGELIGDDKHIVTVADLRSVWAELNVHQKDIDKIKLGQSAQIYFNDIENAVSGKIFYLSPTVDVHSRTATARVRLNNSSGYWKPGMFIISKVLTNFVEVDRAVTLNAIQNFEGRKVVFVREGENFKPQPVTIGKTNTNYAEVLTGLNTGQTYIAEGAFVIKSELLKESFGGGHGH